MSRKRRNPAKEEEPQTQFEKECDAFDKLKPSLLKDEKYKGRYVAVVGGKVIADSDDDSKLSQLIDEKYGNIPAYIGRVAEEEEVIELPSPELV